MKNIFDYIYIYIYIDNKAEVYYLEPYQTSVMELIFEKKLIQQKKFTTFTTAIWQRSKYAFAMHVNGTSDYTYDYIRQQFNYIQYIAYCNTNIRINNIV